MTGTAAAGADWFDDSLWGDVVRWCRDEVRRSRLANWLQDADQDDACQDALFRVVRKKDGFTPDGKATLETWVRVQARYACLDRLDDLIRGRILRDRCLPPESAEIEDRRSTPPISSAEADELDGAYRRCRERLPDTLRARHDADVDARLSSIPRIRLLERFKVKLDTLRKSIYQARINLRKCLEGLGFPLS